MNGAYKLVWNTAQQAWTVASELAKGKTKSSSKSLKAALVLLVGLGSAGVQAAVEFDDLLITLPTPPTVPVGESVGAGNATFDRSVTNQLTINQTSSKLITNWSSFDVASNGKVIFAQPDAASIALNRVTSGNPTQILGQVTANGQLVIVNPNGITFGSGSQVSAASIIGSVLDIQDSDFNNGTLLFNRASATGGIDNQGSLTATAGSVSLLAPTVKNSGAISATAGHASLINADGVDLSTLDPAVTTTSSIAGLIKNSGSLQATQLSSVGGKILLQGDTSQASSKVELTGTLTAEESSVNARQIHVAGVLDVDGTNHILKLTSTTPYNLSVGSKINLNGGNSGFSVNGTAYIVIRDVNQLQAMSNDLTGKYVLANDVDASDTVNWNSGAGFSPVGDNSTAFTGVLDGLGHAVDGLNINRPATNDVGLIGAAQNTLLQNIGLSNINIIGQTNVGGLVGYSFDGSTINNSYAIGSVSGSGTVGGVIGNSFYSTISDSYATANVSSNGYDRVGGLVGLNESTPISNSYAGGSVSGSDAIGGLVGWNFGSSPVINSYATSSVTGTSRVGGLIGWNDYSTITYSYATGSVQGNQYSQCVGGLIGSSGRSLISAVYAAGTVSGNQYVGGLIGSNDFVVNNSYWDISSTGQTQATGVNEGDISTNVIGLTSSQMKNLSSFASLGSAIDAQAGTNSVWRIYEGQTAPLLRSFLSTANVTVLANKTYDGVAFGGGYTLDFGDADSSKILGSAVFGGAGIGARNAGVYNLTVSGLYSDQQGYDIATGGALTINKANLVITSNNVTKTYDGNTSAKGKAVATAGTQVFAGDTLTGGTFAFTDKNAGTGKTVTTAAVTVNDGNGGNNYNISYADNVNSIINKRLLTIAATAVNKVYDGKLTTGTDRPLVTGRQRGDSISSLSQSFLDKNVGTGKTVRVNSGYVINDGNGGNNYDVVLLADNVNGVITPRTLTISTVANTKVYDGSVKAANKPLVTGLATGDRLTGLYQQYETKLVGENKKMLIKAGYVLKDGNGGNNYIVTEQTTNDGSITAH